MVSNWNDPTYIILYMGIHVCYMWNDMLCDLVLDELNNVNGCRLKILVIIIFIEYIKCLPLIHTHTNRKRKKMQIQKK